MSKLEDLSWDKDKESQKEAIKYFPKEIVLPHLEKTLQEAYKEDDDNWLGNLKMLIKYHSFTKNDFKSIDLAQVLEIAAR